MTLPERIKKHSTVPTTIRFGSEIMHCQDRHSPRLPKMTEMGRYPCSGATRVTFRCASFFAWGNHPAVHG